MKKGYRILVFFVAVVVGWVAKKQSFGDGIQNSAGSEPKKAERENPIGEDFGEYLDLADTVLNAGSEEMTKIAENLFSQERQRALVWKAFFARWFRDDPEAAWAFVKEHFMADSKSVLSEIAIEEWALIDPTGTQAALTDPDKLQMKALIRGALVSDIEFAFELLKEATLIEIRPLRNDGRFGFNSDDPFQVGRLPDLWSWKEKVMEFARKNPAAALAWVQGHGDADSLGPVIAGWAMEEPDQARAWLSKYPDREQALIEIGNFVGFSRLYQPEIMDFALSVISAGDRKIEVVQQAIGSLADEDPDLALEEAHRLFKDPYIKAEAIGQIASIVAKTDYEKAWEILGELDPSILGIRRVALPKIEIAKDGEVEKQRGLYQYGMDLTNMRGLVSPAGIKSEMLYRLLKVDKAKTLKLMSEIPVENFFRVGGYAVESWVHFDRREAVTWLAKKFGDQGNIEEVREWIDDFKDGGEVEPSFLESLPNGTVRAALAVELAESPQAALHAVREGGGSVEAIDSIYFNWAYDEPEAALKGIAVDQDAPPEAWETVTSRAFEKLPEETAEIVSNFPAGESRDAAARRIAEMCANDSHPVVAARWTLEIGDGTMRDGALESVLEKTSLDLRVMGNDEVAGEFREMISGDSNLNEAQKNRWLERINLEFSAP